MVDRHHQTLSPPSMIQTLNTRVATPNQAHGVPLRDPFVSPARPPFPARPAPPRPVAAVAAAVQDAYVKYSRSCRWRCTALKWPPPESELEIDECVSQLSSSSLKFDM